MYKNCRLVYQLYELTEEEIAIIECASTRRAPPSASMQHSNKRGVLVLSINRTSTQPHKSKLHTCTSTRRAGSKLESI